MDKEYAMTANSIAGASLGNTQSMNAAGLREMTVGELIDRRIEKAERQARDLRILKDAMSRSFLQCGASKISSLLEL